MRLTLSDAMGIRHAIRDDLTYLLAPTLTRVHVAVEQTDSLGLSLTVWCSAAGEPAERTTSRVFRRRTIDRLPQWGNVHHYVVRELAAQLRGDQVVPACGAPLPVGTVDQEPPSVWDRLLGDGLLEGGAQ